MENKWVTLAIRTYQRAQMIKNVLEQNEIETMIHNLNLENPEMAVGVRVRIKEKDLPKALTIVEEMEKAWEEEATKDLPPKGRKILLPIDLTDNITHTCKYGFHFAKQLNAEIVFLYAYYTPTFTINSSLNAEINTYSLTDSESIRRIISTNNADVENLTNLINKWIDNGELPKIKFSFELKEGVAEDVILDYCKRERPSLVVMNTHGRNHMSDDMFGSVTAEVLEGSVVPVMTVPIETPLMPEDIKRVAFLTNFDQKDLIAIDNAISFLEKDNLEIIFIHVADKKQSWDEVMLVGIKEYFANHYPSLKTDYAIIKNSGNLQEIQPYLEKEKVDLVAMNMKRRTLFARLFKPSVATKLLFNVDTSLLVMHV